MIKDTQVRNEDLNGIDYLNGESSVIHKGGTTVDPKTGATLKGALTKNNGFYSRFNLQNERYWIQSKLEQIVEIQLEQIEYENLPKGLTKYRIEQKILENGYVGIFKFADEYYAVNVSVEDFDIYNEPVKVKVVEPKSSLLNGISLTVGVDVMIIRNNIHKKPIKDKVIRLITAAERTLFQIEKNLTASAPKGLINSKNGFISVDGDNGAVESMEMIINGDNTFYEYKGNDISNNDISKDNNEPVFIPIELPDRTSELITNYSFLKEEIKEIIGAGVNILNGKKERLITGEIDSQQDMSNFGLDHRLNIRIEDYEKCKEIWSDFNIQLSLKSYDMDKGGDENVENFNISE